MELKSNAELIIELKKAMAEKHIGQAELLKMMEDAGHPIAKTTLQRICKEGSEVNDSFRYNDTLKPLAEVLLDNVNGDETNDKLQEKIDALSAQIRDINDYALNSINFMKSQIDLKDTRMERKDQWIQQLMEENKRLNEEVCKLLDKCNNCSKK